MEEKIKKKRNWKLILIITGIVLLSSASWVYYKYYFIYSDGTRVGILYKFSRKGNIFKTYEGEMMLPGLKSKNGNTGTNSNLFTFSVVDEALAKKLMESQGMELELHYNNYNGYLPWRGDTYEKQDGQYIVDKLVKIKNENPNGYGM